VARLVDRFEQLVWDGVTAHGGRVVKLIGDEAMFTMPSVPAALAMAHDLLRAGDRVRIGLAEGTAIAYHGDLYGPTVSLAARLVSLAPPGTALVSDSIAQAAPDATFDRAEIGEIRGFPAGTPAFVLR
jgi:adenylate cyclase